LHPLRIGQKIDVQGAFFMRAVLKTSIFLSGIALLAACSKGDKPPEMSTEQSPSPTQKSMIAVPITASTASLQSALDRALPQTLWTINRKEDQCVAPQKVKVFGKQVKVTPAIGCTIIGNVTRGVIRLRGEGDEIVADVPINARISATDVGGVLKGETATGSAIISARIKIDISENWQTRGTARLTYGWTNPPGIDFLGRRITFTDQADEKLQPILKDVEREVAKEIAKLNVKSQAEQIWRQAFTSLELNRDNPPVWLRLTPQRILYGGYEINGQTTRLNFALEAITESFVSARPADPAATALPNLVKAKIDPQLDVNIPVLAQYRHLTPVILKALIKRSARPLNIPGIGAVNAQFEKVTAYGAPEGKIAVGITLKATPEGGSTTSGKIWVTATPVNEAGSPEVSFTNLSVTGETSDVAGDLLIQLGNSPGFAQLISSALTQNFTKDLNELQQKIKAALDLRREGAFVIRAQVQNFEIGRIRAYGNGVYLPVRMVGKANVDFRPPAS
jgi:hypothetical protein